MGKKISNENEIVKEKKITKKKDEREILSVINKLLSTFEKLNVLIEHELEDSPEINNFRTIKSNYENFLLNIEKKYAQLLLI